jgi:hypothetical protein
MSATTTASVMRRFIRAMRYDERYVDINQNVLLNCQWAF